MLFDLENLNPAVKFYLNEENESEGSVTLKSLTRDDAAKILKKHTKKRRKWRRGQQVIEEEIDTDQVDFDSWDCNIVEWEIYDTKGEAVPCTRENKILLVGQSPWFQNFIFEKLEQLKEQKPMEELEKNSQEQSSDL